jgi:hypothetical protein
MNKKLTREEWINKAIKVHGNKYMDEKLREEWINKAIKVHGDKYDYSKVKYKNNKTKVLIICPEHGEFWQEPSSHLSKHGCPIHGAIISKMCDIKKRLTTNNFIERSKERYGDKYSYDETNYKSYSTKLIIKCNKHNEYFNITPASHLDKRNNGGCDKCKWESIVEKGTRTNFKELATEKHSGKYNYDFSNYITQNIKVKIKCNKCLHIFEQTPKNHLNFSGCPFCRMSRGEAIIEKWLINNTIDYYFNFRFNDCVGIKNKLPFDFYLPMLNVCIEFDGGQHLKPIGNDSILNFYNLKINDEIKNLYCINKGINLIRIPYIHISKISEILNEKLLIKKVA